MKELICFILGAALSASLMYGKIQYNDNNCKSYMISIGNNCIKVIDEWTEKANKYETMYKQMESPCNQNINIISKLRQENEELRSRLK